MARTAAAAGIWSRGRAFARAVQHCLGAPLLLSAGLLIVLSSPGACQTEPVRGEATFSAQRGYARLMLKLTEDVDSEVTAAGSILIIRFKRPVDVPVDKLSDAVPDYVGSARRDPDGSAIRLSLARRVTINTMTAGERLFVDLLPDSWSGQPPGLPAEVVRELSERARARRTRIARAARDGGSQEARADPRPRLGAADLRPLRVRDARRRRCLQRAERSEADAAVQLGAQFRSGGCQDRGAAERCLDQSEDPRAKPPRWKSR